MKNVIKKIHIDLYSPTSYEVIKAQQGDNRSRIIEFLLYDQGEPYMLESQDIEITMEGHRGDNSSFIKDCYFTDNIISATLDSDVLSESGTVCAKIVMYNSSDKTILSTIPFQISVQKNPCDKRNIETKKQSVINWLILHFKHLKNNLNSHLSDFSNPHKVTKEQIGLGNVPNVTTNEQAPTYKKADLLSELESGEPLSTAFGKISAAIANLITHVQDHLRHITSVEREQWKDSYNKKHVHENKTILDQTTASYTSEEKNKLLSLYTASEIDNKLSMLETNIDWKESVDTYDDIPAAYPNPEDGWTVNVKDTDFTYRYNGVNWIAISANAIPKATASVDGLFSKEDYVKLESLSNGYVTGVKGNTEHTYRTGNVNLTPEHIGALALSGGRMTGNIGLSVPGSYSGAHAIGLIYTNKNQPDTTIGGIGMFGTNGIFNSAFIGFGQTPWSVNSGLYMTESDIKWKNSKMLTESSGNAVSATAAAKLKTPRTIDGISFDGSTDITHYGVCSTAGDSNNKVVTIPGFQPKEGARIVVNFLSKNTAVGPVTLNVNSTGQRTIVKYANGPNTAYIRKGLYELIYAEEYWVLATGSIDYDVVNFVSYDTPDSSATSWTSTAPISNDLSLRSILSKISILLKNVRYLHNCMKYTDFSSEITKIDTRTFATPMCYVEHGIVYIYSGFIPNNTTTVVQLFKIPAKYAPRSTVLGNIGYTSSAGDVGKIASVSINQEGIVSFFQKQSLNYGNSFSIIYPMRIQ
ncbi:MAG: hypothetical protein HFI83_10265 [Eubacterium sp.]|nr:hypothetical protein [Eubacterium sp.]